MRAMPSLKDPFAHDPLGRMRLQEVRPAHIRGVLDRVMEQGYSARTVGKVLMRLKALFREALRLELVARNPAEAVSLRLSQGEKAARALEPHEVARLLEEAERSKKPRYGPPPPPYAGNGATPGGRLLPCNGGTSISPEEN